MDEECCSNLCAISERFHLGPLHPLSFSRLESRLQSLCCVWVVLVCFGDVLGQLLLHVRRALVALARGCCTAVRHYEDLAKLGNSLPHDEGILVRHSCRQGLSMPLQCILRDLEEIAPLLLQLLLPLLIGQAGGLLGFVLHHWRSIWISHVLGPRLITIHASDVGDLLSSCEHTKSRGYNLRLVDEELLLISIQQEAKTFRLVIV
mmetsp:Transcript_4385/g.7780  ORF Transcript_4385/g.7780 Transcript_4385/m.7780 type:complete len:205 (-) Transcript_4385:145-759(-)